MSEPRFRIWDPIPRRLIHPGILVVYYHEVGRVAAQWQDETAGVYRYESWSRGMVVLEQSTGLKDKNGREIFEGDIIQWGPWYPGGPRYCNVVAWEEATGHFSPFLHETQFDNGEGFSWDGPEHAEVVGNIHENPELVTR